MVYGLWQSAAGMQVQEFRQAVVSNNLANVDTPGFKQDRITFQERLSASVASGLPRTRHHVLDALPGGVFESPVYTDFSQSNLQTAQGPLDVAIEGDGFLVVRTPQGNRYTRDGRMTLDTGGRLLHQAGGAPVMDAKGRPIILDVNALDRVKIDPQGHVFQGELLVGELALVDFHDREALVKEGANLWSAGTQRPQPAGGALRQNAIESSGVDPVSSLVEMIEATRVYQMNANLLTLQDESLSRVVNDVGRIG